MTRPDPTPIFRLSHIDNLQLFLKRRALHAPNHTPDDGLRYTTIHNADIQQQRRIIRIPCGPQGVIHDYVAFYFGPRSPMLFQLHTGRTDYRGGQEPLIYLVSTAQSVWRSGAGFAYSDGHGIAKFTSWFDDLSDLGKLDWEAIYARIWKDTVADMDRQRRKQAEFLVRERCDWKLIQEIGVLNSRAKTKVESILSSWDSSLSRPVLVRPDWYY